MKLEEKNAYIIENIDRRSAKEIAAAIGEPVKTVYRRIEKLRAKGLIPGKNGWRGCDEDCFNCKYSDCLMPDWLM